MTEPLLIRSYSQIEPPRALILFEKYLAARALSRETHRIYLAALIRYDAAVNDLLAPQREQVEHFLRERRTQVGPSTFNQDLVALRAFYRFAVRFELMTQDQVPRLPRRHRAPKRLPRYLSEHEVGRLLAEPDLATLVGFRDHVMLCLAYETGVRASELVNLHLGDVRDDRWITVTAGKGRVDRWLPISVEMQRLLGEWIKLRRTTRPGKSSVLFVTQRGRAFTRGRAVWEIFQRYARRALGYGCGYHRIKATRKRTPWTGQYPHLLRASMATHMLERGCNLRAVQELLGHANIKTTALYLGVDLTLMKQTIASHHPRGKKR